MSQSWVGLMTALKTFPRLLGTPSYLGNLLQIQTSKSFHNFRPPKDGRAKKIRQYSVRITDLCNLRCHTCGQWGESGYLHDASVKELRQREVSLARHIELLRDLKAKGHTPSVYLWGGEPMLYPGAMEVIEEAARLGMPPSIATNATGLARRAERIVAAPMFLVQISLDGPSAEVHNASRPGHTPRVDNFAMYPPQYAVRYPSLYTPINSLAPDNDSDTLERGNNCSIHRCGWISCIQRDSIFPIRAPGDSRSRRHARHWHRCD